MKLDSRRIRELIGDNQIDQAIRLMIDYLEESKEHDLLDQMILQKSRFSDYMKKHLGGFGDEKEINAIRASLLEIAREMSNRSERPPAQPPVQPLQPAEQPKEKTVDNTASTNTEKSPFLKYLFPDPGSTERITQCFFTGDLNLYFVLKNFKIVMLNPMTGAEIEVAKRTVSFNPAIAWLYQFPNGIYYSVDFSGIIWGANAYGVPIQVGYVQYL